MIPHRVTRHRPPSPLARRLAVPAPIDGASALPADIVRALRVVAAEMRNMPRDCARDRHELVHWLARLARRLEAVAASKARLSAVIAPRAGPETPPTGTPAAPRTVPAPAPRPRYRSPPWRALPIAAAARRAAEAAGQLDLFR